MLIQRRCCNQYISTFTCISSKVIFTSITLLSFLYPISMNLKLLFNLSYLISSLLSLHALDITLLIKYNINNNNNKTLRQRMGFIGNPAEKNTRQFAELKKKL